MDLPQEFQGNLRFVVLKVQHPVYGTGYVCTDGNMDTCGTAQDVISRMQIPDTTLEIVAELDGISNEAATALYRNFENLPMQGGITRLALMQLLVAGRQ